MKEYADSSQYTCTDRRSGKEKKEKNRGYSGYIVYRFSKGYVLLTLQDD